MGGSSFCAFVDALRAAAPALPSSDLPTLYCFSQLAKAFPAQPQSRKEPDQPQPQSKAVAEQPQDDLSAQPMVNGHEEKEDKIESKAEVETMSSDDKAESVTSEPKSDVRFDVKPDAKIASKADAKVASKADVKAASKGGKAPSRAASSDGGTDAKASKAVPKVPSSVKVTKHNIATSRHNSNNTIILVTVRVISPSLVFLLMIVYHDCTIIATYTDIDDDNNIHTKSDHHMAQHCSLNPEHNQISKLL